MFTLVGWAVGSVLLWLPMVTPGQHVRPTLTIRVYNGVGVSRGRMQEAERTVRTVFCEAGLDVTWRECHPMSEVPSADIDTCGDALQSDEVVVRVLAAPGSQPSLPSALGFSYVDRATRRGWLATAFADRIIALAGRLHIDAGRLLGRTMVHEVGHLVLATIEHTAAGLMRRQWSDLAILMGHGDRFLADQAADLQAAVLVRSQQPPLAAGELARLGTVLVPLIAGNDGR